MSVQAMAWVIDKSKHNSNDFVVLLMIANHARSDGTGAWPTVPMLAREARCSVRAVQYSIQRLTASGELRIDREAGPRNSRIYSIPGVQKLHPSEVPNLHPRGAKNDVEGCKSRQRNKEEPSLTVQTKVKSMCTPQNGVHPRPTVSEVRAYCDERKNGVDPIQWVDHYTANGWKVGRTPMKDWKAAVRTWERNQFNRVTESPPMNGRPDCYQCHGDGVHASFTTPGAVVECECVTGWSDHARA